MRTSVRRADADERLPILLRVQGLRDKAQAAARRLLRVLFLRVDLLSTGARNQCCGRRLITLAADALCSDVGRDCRLRSRAALRKAESAPASAHRRSRDDI